jgi:hypothetical protein
MTPLKASEAISAELEKRGLKNNFSISDTDYGCSCYFIFYKNSESIDKLKVRISDHSVENTHRMTEEYHINSSNVNVEKVVRAIELYLHPERFDFVACSEGFTHRINGIFGKYNRK